MSIIIFYSGESVKTMSLGIFFFLMLACDKTGVVTEAMSQNSQHQTPGRLLGEAPPISWGLTPEEITKQCTDAQKELEQRLHDLITKSSADFKSLAKIDLTISQFRNISEPLGFYQHVSSDAAARKASMECSQSISNYFIDLFQREDFYKLVKEIHQNHSANLGKVDSLLLQEYLADFRENGLNLPQAQRESFKALSKELVALSLEFSETLGEWNVTLDFSKAELQGLSAEFLQNLKPSAVSGKDYILTLKYPDVIPALEEVKDEKVREKIYVAFKSQGGQENKERLTRAIEIRDEQAKMLGFKSHADRVLSRRMAKTPQSVRNFLNTIFTHVQGKGSKDFGDLAMLKRQDTKNPSAKLNVWDLSYYDNKLKKEQYQVDDEKISEYFPLESVLEGMFAVYEKLLGVSFVERADASVWDPKVKAFAIVDNQSKAVLAWFYMDIFPRVGKYGHAAAFTLNTGYREDQDAYHRPISAIVANFTEPTSAKPSLLKHSEVETLFHEFGHIMHQTLTRSDYGYFSGSSVKSDFVEAPSQMLENWVWEREPLAMMSKHYLTGEPLPQEMLDKMLKARNVQIGRFYLKQIFLASIDMDYHDGSHLGEDTTKQYHDLASRIYLIAEHPSAMPEASFGHLMGGYDSGYYGYLWSKVYAEAMFERFRREGLLNPAVGNSYRQWILEPGGSQDPMELINGFLGHEPTIDAFLSTIDTN